ncbi:hypothetical protein RJG79_04535 [Mycoplasmatota bacterium WC44]
MKKLITLTIIIIVLGILTFTVVRSDYLGGRPKLVNVNGNVYEKVGSYDKPMAHLEYDLYKIRDINNLESCILKKDIIEKDNDYVYIDPTCHGEFMIRYKGEMYHITRMIHVGVPSSLKSGHLVILWDIGLPIVQYEFDKSNDIWVYTEMFNSDNYSIDESMFMFLEIKD